MNARLVVLGLLVCLTLVVAASPALADAQAPVETTWPPEDHREASQMQTLLAEALATDEEPVRLGHEETGSFRLDRVNDTVSRAELVIGHEGDEATHELEIAHRPAPREGNISLAIPADQLPLVAAVSLEDADPAQGWVSGPPEAFDLEAEGEPREIAAELADRLELPQAHEGTTIHNVTWERRSTASVPLPFVGEEACLIGASGCAGRVSFTAECESCFALVRTVHPTPMEQLAEAWSEGPPVGAPIANRAAVTFDESGRAVRVKAFLHADVNTSSLQAPQEARQTVLAELADRGYEPSPTEGQTLGVKLQLGTPEASADVTEARYAWFAVVVPTDETTDEPGEYRGFVTQDPLTGRVLDVDLTADGAAPAGDGGARATPAGALAVTALAVAMAAAIRRR